jgi:hypothetical protein
MLQRRSNRPRLEQPALRPVGAWVVAGFVLFATLAMWTLVSIIFHARS